MTFGQLASLAFRESRFARRRLFLFLFAISLGVASLVAVQGFASNMQREVRTQARAMLGADLQLESREPFGPRTESLLESLESEGLAVARVTEFASMARHTGNGATRLVQVHATTPGFPFYGTIETEPAGEWSRLHDDRHVVVDPALLAALGAAVGDTIAIGSTQFRITAELRRMPGDIEIASSFAPRVFIPAAYLDETELLGFGARVEYEAYLRTALPEQAEAIEDANRTLFRAERVRSRTLEDQQEIMQDALTRLAGYLGLVGVFALMLGGIGVASAMSAHIANKVDNVAVLRCIGASARQVLSIYLIQAGAMGLVGAALGVVIGLLVQMLLPVMLEGLLPVDVTIRPSRSAVLTGLVVGTWAAAAFALLPLLKVRGVSPIRALRRRVEPLAASPRDPLRAGVIALLVGSVLALVSVQAGSVMLGLALTLGVGATLLALWLAARAATALLRRSRRSALPYPLRQGLASLHRPGNQTVAVVLALGFGVFLIATLILTQANILRPLNVDTTTRFNLIFLDVQVDQVDDVERRLADLDVEVVQSVPLVSMRISALDGRPAAQFGGGFGSMPFGNDGPGNDGPRNDGLSRDGLSNEGLSTNDPGSDGTGSDDPGSDGTASDGGSAARGDEARGDPRGWALRREYRSTYRADLTDSETLVAGTWWDDAGSAAGSTASNSTASNSTATAPAGMAADDLHRVSLETSIADDLGVEIGSRIDWDIQGVTVPTVVTSLRDVDWARLEPNFFAVFEPRALLAAPQMRVLLARADTASLRATALSAIAEAHPNVSAIDLTVIQAAFDDVIGRIALVIRFLAAFSVATGFIVLLGAVATGRLQRIREAVLLKTLGATRAQIGTILLCEYSLLGLLSAVVGAGLSLAAGWALARFLFDVPFVAEPVTLLALGAGIAVLAALIGLSGSRAVFRSTPMEALREE